MHWHKHQRKRGQECNSEIPQCLHTAHIIGLLISPDFPDAEAFWDQEIVRIAIRRYGQQGVRVIPIRLRSVDCQGEPYDGLQALPREDEPVDSKYWKNQDQALLSIAKDLRLEITDVKAEIAKRQEHQRENFIDEAAHNRLNYIREYLGITEEEATQIEEETTQSIAAQIAWQRRKRNQRQVILASIFAAISIFFAYNISASLKKSAEDFSEQGIIYYSQKNWQKAIEYYTQAIQIDPNNAIYYNNRGNSYYFNRNWQAAVEDYTQSIRLDPNNVHAYRYRGEARSYLGDRQGAIEDLRKAARLYTEQGKIYDYQAVKTRIIQLITQRQ
jgi:tetratricopeptide (TPR) repeat protein